MCRTKIVCTIGPATSSEERLEALMRAGMNVACLNFSHGVQADHARVIERIRALSTRLGCPIAFCKTSKAPRYALVRQGWAPLRINGWSQADHNDARDRRDG